MIHIGSMDFKYSVQGSQGPLILLLHGFGGSPLEWHQVIPDLAQDHRLIVPNMMPLFSSDQRVGFSKQVELLAGVVNHVNAGREPFFLVGSSFGGTLSFGLRAHFKSMVLGHVMLNPMPLDPLASLRHTHLGWMCKLNLVPGLLRLWMATSFGKSMLRETGKVFGYGTGGRRELDQLSGRKLDIIGKALQRFAWIAKNENWSYWSEQLREHLVPLLVITGNADPLFTEKDYRSYQNLVPLSQHMPLSNGTHLLARTHAAELGAHIRQFVADARGVSNPKVAAPSKKQAI